MCKCANCGREKNIGEAFTSVNDGHENECLICEECTNKLFKGDKEINEKFNMCECCGEIRTSDALNENGVCEVCQKEFEEGITFKVKCKVCGKEKYNFLFDNDKCDECN